MVRITLIFVFHFLLPLFFSLDVPSSVCVDAVNVGENTLYQNIASSENVASMIFLVSRSSNIELLLPNLILQLSTRLTFESIKSDTSNLGRPMRTWEFRLKSDVD